MTILLSCGRKFQTYIEFNSAFGINPIFLIEDFKNETIIHLPYTQIIYTPSPAIEGEQNERCPEHMATCIIHATKDKS